MYKNAPVDYVCPFCLLAAGLEDKHVSSVQSDIVYQDAEVMAFICTRQWPRNKGHVLIVPVEHFENIYDLPLRLAAKIHELSRQLALAMKAAYKCDGISTRQHNEPSGNQEVWHYHLHLFPRYENDRLYATENGEVMPAGERAAYAMRLRKHLDGWRFAAVSLGSPAESCEGQSLAQ